MTTGERIRHIRNERGISQKQLSEMCGLSEPAIRNYELGNRKPSAQILDKIAAALTVTAAELVLPELPLKAEYINARDTYREKLKTNECIKSIPPAKKLKL